MGFCDEEGRWVYDDQGERIGCLLQPPTFQDAFWAFLLLTAILITILALAFIVERRRRRKGRTQDDDAGRRG